MGEVIYKDFNKIYIFGLGDKGDKSLGGVGFFDDNFKDLCVSTNLDKLVGFVLIGKELFMLVFGSINMNFDVFFRDCKWFDKVFGKGDWRFWKVMLKLDLDKFFKNWLNKLRFFISYSMEDWEFCEKLDLCFRVVFMLFLDIDEEGRCVFLLDFRKYKDGVFLVFVIFLYIIINFWFGLKK